MRGVVPQFWDADQAHHGYHVIHHDEVNKYRPLIFALLCFLVAIRASLSLLLASTERSRHFQRDERSSRDIGICFTPLVYASVVSGLPDP